MSDSDRVVHRIEKRDGEEVRATVNKSRGKFYVHLRVYFRAADETWAPTRKGITLRGDQLDELEFAIAALRRAIEAEPR